MFFAEFNQTQAMASANLSLAMLGIFTIGLPILLVTRSEKTKENREFLNTPFRLWNELNQQEEEAIATLENINIEKEIPLYDHMDNVICSEISTEVDLDDYEINQSVTSSSNDEDNEVLIAA